MKAACLPLVENTLYNKYGAVMQSNLKLWPTFRSMINRVVSNTFVNVHNVN